MSRKHIIYIATVVVLLLSLSLLCFSSSLAKHYGKHRYFVDSPDKQYQLEMLVVPNYYLGALKMDTPGFIRAFDKNGKFFYESEIFDLYDNCQIIWPIPNRNKLDISVGMDVSIPIPSG